MACAILLFFRRVTFGNDRLRSNQQCTATETLKETESYQLPYTVGLAAHEGEKGKDDDGDCKVITSAKLS